MGVTTTSYRGWRVLNRLGGGGMGVVFLAERDGHRAALKIIRPELADDPAFRARFRREVELARRVGGLRTCRVLDADPDADEPWIASVYIPGPTLQEHVAHYGPLTDGALWAFAAGLAEALTSIHDAGVVHRDLKPANVVLAADGPRVLDFGIARAADSTTITHSGLLVGSAGFMAPEQASAEDVGPSADVFAWASTVMFAATGRPPFGTGPAPAVLHRIVHSVPDLTGIDIPLAALLTRAFAKVPDARPSAQQLVENLVRTQGSAAAAAVTRLLTSAWKPTVELRPEGEPEIIGGTARRSRWPWAAGATAVTVVAGVVFAATGHGPIMLQVPLIALRDQPTATAPAASSVVATLRAAAAPPAANAASGPADPVAFLHQYWEAVDRHDWAAVYNSQGADQRAKTSQAQIARDYRTTRLFDAAVLATPTARNTAQTSFAVSVQYVSTQDAADGPDGQACTLWNQGIILDRLDGRLRITGTHNNDAGLGEYSPCPSGYTPEQQPLLVPDNLLPLQGFWSGHGRSMAILGTTGFLDYRTYIRCDQNPYGYPCDQFIGDEIISGGHSFFTFSNERTTTGTYSGDVTVLAISAPQPPDTGTFSIVNHVMTASIESDISYCQTGAPAK
ncbi:MULTISPECIES: serine/threonine-protein kinase, partial [unclassified Frankia]|uniref:serine/threonine protein kinase n=1 Tax=unclassified Frankia TaxID=2632575 RepID=UPI002AD437D1